MREPKTFIHRSGAPTLQLFLKREKLETRNKAMEVNG